ncbi:MAG: aldehyde dehydrogenase family protein, partial [Gramella sp.]|nr:aldehyde dehydrogenase family protein [Christiangramia sp.]
MSEEKKLTTTNPVNGKTIENYKMMSDQEMEKAIKDCHHAFMKWKSRSAEDRAAVIKNIGKKLAEHKDELAKLMTNEMGKLVKQSHQELELCSGICDYTASNGPDSLKDEERELPEGGKGFITYSPLGVIYGIQPWNFPSYQVVRYSIANLMAGNG